MAPLTAGLFADGTLPKPVAGQFIGVRINPQIGGGTIASVSTATKTSKFGIPLLDNQAQVMKMFADNPWISMIHCRPPYAALTARAICACLCLVLRVHRFRAHVSHVRVRGTRRYVEFLYCTHTIIFNQLRIPLHACVYKLTKQLV